MPAYKALEAKRQSVQATGDKVLYNKLRNQANRVAKSLSSNFYRKSVNVITDSKNWWKTIKSILRLNGSNSVLQCFVNNEYDGNFQKFTDELNEIFVLVSADLDPLHTSNTPYSFRPILEEFVIPLETTVKQLMKVKVSKAVGPDEIPNWLLRDLAHIIAGNINAIHNSSIREGYVPYLW